MPVDWSPFVAMVEDHQRFLLTTHVRPDGDGLGSMLALTEALEGLGKEVSTVVASTIPPRYDFLEPKNRVQRFELPGDAYRNAEVAIVLDTGTWNQLGDFGTFLASLDAKKAVIDHHVTQDGLDATPFVDTSAEATGRLVYEAITALGTPLQENSANALFVAVAMDTGWFRHNNTTAATFQLAEQLMQAGAKPSKLYSALFEQSSVARLQLIGIALARIQVVDEGRVAYTEVHRSDYELTGALPQDTEDLINYPRSVSGVEVAVLFMEQPRGGVKVSFRSRSRVDVARVAQQFGGGGHRLASGTIVPLPLEQARQQVLAAVTTALQENPA